MGAAIYFSFKPKNSPVQWRFTSHGRGVMYESAEARRVGMDKTDKYKEMINKEGSTKIVIFMTFLVLDCGHIRYIKVK